MIDLTLAQVSVADLATAEAWYTQVLEAGPTERPMDGLIEWRFAADHGLQVFVDLEAAGGSTAIIGLADFDEQVARLDALGIDHSGVQPGGGGRLTALPDPDGNRLVLLDSQAAHGRFDPGDDSGGAAHATLRFSRTVPAPVERVWRAMADVDQRVRWSVPPGEAIEYHRSEFAAGGVDEYRCGPAGELDNHVTARYVRIEAPRFYVATSRLSRHGSEIAVDMSTWSFDDVAEGTRVRVVVQVTSLAGADLLAGYRNGHELTLDRLVEHVRDGG